MAGSAKPNRKSHNLAFESQRAMLSLAGIRMLSQSLVTGGGAASDNSYTMVNSNARRVIIFVNHATNVVRFNMNAAATASHLPILNQRYFIVDARGPYQEANGIAVAADVIHFFDTTGSTPVHFLEID